MNASAIKSAIWRNVGSNYLRTGVRLLTGLLTFRLLFQSLETEVFGFWALLWSLFGYGVLLDFGLGFTVLKKTADYSATGESAALSRLLSTVLAFYLACGAVILLAGIGASPWLVSVFKVSPENRELFTQLTRWFFAGVACSLPTCLFSEVLKGLNKIHLANNTAMFFAIVNLALVATATQLGWGLETIFLGSLACILLPNFVNGWLARRDLPEVRVSPRLISLRALRDVAGFSVCSFGSTISNLVRNRTDLVVVSTTLGVTSAAAYQAGAKIGEMFGLFTSQIADVLSPAAAHLRVGGQRGDLRALLLQSTRLVVLVSLPLLCLMVFQVEDLIRILTGLESVSPATLLSGVLILLWVFVIAASQSAFKGIYFVCGRERGITRLNMAEAALNLALSILLIWIFPSIVAVAAASLVSALYIAVRHLWPMAAAETGLSLHRFTWEVFSRPGAICLVLIAWLIACRAVPNDAPALLRVTVQSFVGLALIAPLIWFHGLNAAERRHLRRMTGRRRFTPALT